MKDTIVVAGSLAQRALHGGHTWVFLQYLLGFRRLGYDVVFVDRLEPDMCIDEAGKPAPFHTSANLRYLVDVMHRFGLDGSWSVLFDRGAEVVGLGRQELTERVRHSVVLINVMGFLDDADLLSAAPRRVFLDIDPGFGQMWRALGLHDMFTGHDDYVTVGERIGTADCTIPTGGIPWIGTKQPVVLDEWSPASEPSDRITSVGAWRGPFAPIEYGGHTYGLRVHEFRKFIELPLWTGAPFEIALDIDEQETSDLDALREAGWKLADPRVVAADPWRYRDYIRSSAAEFMVAKNIYVESHSGWFSDRSICYLASARPVLAQDTGLDSLLPTGEGLVTFSTLEGAARGVDAIRRDYRRHARMAREIAEEYFASDRVLTSLLDRLAV